MDSHEINSMLVSRLSDVCFHLFPNGKVEGNHFMVGGLNGDTGKSLQVTVNGGAAGRWKDFANPEDKGATPLWLWAKARNLTYTEALKEARDWLGVRHDDFGIRRHQAKSWEMPSKFDVSGVVLAEPNTKVTEYVVGERRIDPVVFAKAKVAESSDGEWVVLPYFDPGQDKAFHIKKFKVDRVNGKKEIMASKGTRRGLYGKQLIDDNVSEITICEGEIDALSLHTYKIPGVSVPNGVADTSWVDTEWEWLERFERINVCMDMDEPGKAAAQDLCKRLGLHRSFIVSLPKKDVNECLVSGIGADEILKCLRDAKPIEMDEIKRARDYTNEVYEYYETDWSKRGWETPWYPALPWRVRKAELTILTGFAGSGKTASLNQLLIHLVQQGCKIMDSSLEIKPAMTLYNMTRCALGKGTASREEILACHEWINDSMFFHDCIGSCNPKRLLGAMEYARKRHGVDVFVIDSLFKCGLDPADFGAQREFADQLTSFCNNTGAHVILVAHARKSMSGNELTPPSKADVSGSADITNAAFNVIVWYRNKMKKRKLDELMQAFPRNEEEIARVTQEHDGLAILDKQRFGEGEEAQVKLWFHKQSQQFHFQSGKFIPYFSK